MKLPAPGQVRKKRKKSKLGQAVGTSFASFAFSLSPQ